MSNNSDQYNKNDINVAAILEGLRAEVRARRIAQGQIEESPLDRDIRRALDEIELYRVVSAHWPLTGGTLPQRAVNLVNKVVRRYLRWYINPIVEQQNAYNDAVARALRLLADAYADLSEQLADERRTTGDDRSSTDDEAISQASSLKSQASVQGIMAEVRRRAQSEPAARFPDLELRMHEPQLRLREHVSAHWPLSGRTPAQRAIAIANKLVRRYLRWYINPIVEQQNSANAALTAALIALARLDADRRMEVAALRNQKSGVRSQKRLTPDS